MSTQSKSETPRRFLSGTVWLALMGVNLPAHKVEAVLVTLEIAGTVVTSSSGAFGENGAVPYLFSITYDTSLDMNSEFYATGATLGTNTTTHEWHGYSKDGITATSLTFGTNTWAAGNIGPLPRTPATGVSADLWFDTDIAVSVPSRMWTRFGNANGTLDLGGTLTAVGTVELTSGVSIEDTSDFGKFANSSSSTISAVPEAPAWLMMVFVTALAGLILGICRRSNKAFPRDD